MAKKEKKKVHLINFFLALEETKRWLKVEVFHRR